MIPSRLQAPPRKIDTGQMICVGPPATSTFFGLFSATKATKRLSGDQKAKVAPSVPASGRAVTESIVRSQSWGFPVLSVDEKTSIRPSGEKATLLNAPPSGGGTTNR